MSDAVKRWTPDQGGGLVRVGDKRWDPEYEHTGGPFVLATAYDALEAENVRWRDALRKYSHHLAECDWIVNMYECTCGLEQVRAALAPAQGDA